MNLTYACTIMFKNQIDNCCQKYISLDFMILSLIAIEDNEWKFDTYPRNKGIRVESFIRDYKFNVSCQ